MLDWAMLPRMRAKDLPVSLVLVAELSYINLIHERSETLPRVKLLCHPISPQSANNDQPRLAGFRSFRRGGSAFGLA